MNSKQRTGEPFTERIIVDVTVLLYECTHEVKTYKYTVSLSLSSLSLSLSVLLLLPYVANPFVVVFVISVLSKISKAKDLFQ